MRGREITTLEGLPESERKQFADAFAACGGLQCGLYSGHRDAEQHYQISKKGSSLTRESMAPHLGAHSPVHRLRQIDAIEAVAHGTPVEPPTVKSGVGARGMKYEAHPLTLGDRPYIDDIRVPGMLHAALHLTDHTRAGIKNIDVANAIAAPGVVSVLTATDIPGELRSGLIHKDWPLMIPVGGTTSFGGDVLAVVVADTREHARAADLIEVEYTVHSPVTDAKAALALTLRGCGVGHRLKCAVGERVSA